MWLGLDDCHSLALWAGDLSGEDTVNAELQDRLSDDVVSVTTPTNAARAERWG